MKVVTLAAVLSLVGFTLFLGTDASNANPVTRAISSVLEGDTSDKPASGHVGEGENLPL